MPSATVSNALNEAQMNQLLKGESFTPPSTIYLALMKSVPALDGQGAQEVSNAGTGYERIALPCNSTTWTGPSGTNQEYSNAQDLSFGIPTADWGTIYGAALYSDPTSVAPEHLLFTGSLGVAKTVNNGDGAPRILKNQLRIIRAAC